jgi:hypothetical protein
MRVWTAAEGVCTAAHHAELTYIALVQQYPQSLPVLHVQVVKPAPQALLVLPSVKQCIALEVACAFAGEYIV